MAEGARKEGSDFLKRTRAGDGTVRRSSTTGDRAGCWASMSSDAAVAPGTPQKERERERDGQERRKDKGRE